MVRRVVKKVMWVGRATVFMVGLAVIVGVVFGLASLALAHTGVDTKLFHLGHSNTATALTRLTANIANPALHLVNTSTSAGATALQLQTASSKPPLTVNSRTKVPNLNADQVDGQDSASFVQGLGKVYVGRVVVTTSNPYPNEVVITVPGFATVRTLNCQSGAANVQLAPAGSFTSWHDNGAADPYFFSISSTDTLNSSFQATDRTTWHLSDGTGSSAKAATIDVYTHADGSNCIYSATAQVWGQ